MWVVAMTMYESEPTTKPVTTGDRCPTTM